MLVDRIIRSGCNIRAPWTDFPRKANLPTQRNFAITCLKCAELIGAESSKNELARVRNIGIIAHIDAGKTTTTERMLYYSGFTRRIGDVDEGSTVTDFLPAERARGITIQSAAITFHWPADASANTSVAVPSNETFRHTINLIDTPGHADFTFEVIRSLRVLDGAVCILDGVAGVEAQTEKVWHQANGYSIPRIIYVNKLDREGAAFHRTVKEVASRLHTFPALCQIPWWSNGKFVGLADVIHLRALRWDQTADGSRYTCLDLSELRRQDEELANELQRARVALVELLTEHDELMVEKFLDAGEDYLLIEPQHILQSLRKALLSRSQSLTPVFVGASFRNIGVQPLLDAVNSMLPSPLESSDSHVRVGNTNTRLTKVLNGEVDEPKASGRGENTQPLPSKKRQSSANNLSACALAFKVVNDAKRGMLVYVRVYVGSITRSALLYNTSLGVSERVPRLMRMFASEAVEIQSIDEGQIGVLSGLKHTRTGDTLIVTAGGTSKSGPPALFRELQLRPIAIPPPVFFTSIEPNSLAEEKSLDEAIALLLREDPSLHVSSDPETGQKHLAGMGELHLEIARDRLINEYRVKATMGAIEISYRETIDEPSQPCSRAHDDTIPNGSSTASCLATVSPLVSGAVDQESDTNHVLQLTDNNVLVVDHPSMLRSGKPAPNADSEGSQLPSSFTMASVVETLRAGTSAALARGPSHSFPIHSVVVRITLEPQHHLSTTATVANISTAARLAVRAALSNATATSGSVLMEPVMNVSIAVPEAAMGSVVHDLNAARGGHVLSLDNDAEESSRKDNEQSYGWINDEQDASAASELTSDQLNRVYAPPDPFGGAMDNSAGLQASSHSQQRHIKARVPLKEMVGYLKHLRSLTGGRGTFVMSVDRFERMSAQRARSALGR